MVHAGAEITVHFEHEGRFYGEDYVNQFSSGDPIVQENMDLKALHTRSGYKAIANIGSSLGLEKLQCGNCQNGFTTFGDSERLSMPLGPS